MMGVGLFVARLRYLMYQASLAKPEPSSSGVTNSQCAADSYSIPSSHQFHGYSGSFINPEPHVSIHPPKALLPRPKLIPKPEPKPELIDPNEILGLAKEAEEAVKVKKKGRTDKIKVETVSLSDSPPKKSNDLNQMAKGLAEINQRIAQLEKEIDESKKVVKKPGGSNSSVPAYIPTPIDKKSSKDNDLSYVPQTLSYAPGAICPQDDSEYTYTPAHVAPMNPKIKTAEEKVESKSKRKLEKKKSFESRNSDSSSAKKLKSSDPKFMNEQQKRLENELFVNTLSQAFSQTKKMDIKKKNRTPDVGISAKLDLAGTRKEKKKRVVIIKKEENNASSCTAKTTDLFGEDSDNEDMPVPADTVETAPPSDPCSHSEEEEVVEDPAPSTKRMAHNTSYNAELTRRRAPGAAKGHLATPQQQLKLRYDNLKKAKQDLLHKAIHKDETEKNMTVVLEATNSPPEEKKPKLAGVDHREGALAATVPKGERRTAHAVKPEGKPTSTRPVIPCEIGAKIPSSLRNRYLNFFVDECLKFCDTNEDAYSVALEEERQVNEKAQTKGGYLSAAVNSIRQLRAIASNGSSPQGKSPAGNAISHEQVLGGKPATQVSYTLKANKIPKDDQVYKQLGRLYDAILPYIMTEDQLKDNGYPIENSANPYSVLFFKDEAKKQIVPDNNLDRVCSRCGKEFTLTPNGTYTTVEECIYHWGRAWKKKVNGAWDSRYSCCEAELSDPGCSVAKAHVTDCIRESQLSTYTRTQPAVNDSLNGRRIFALDCEMVYTAFGPALARVSVVDYRMNSVYETLVRPTYPVIDCNTRFSGLTPQALANVPVTLLDVQSHLTKIISSETILVGHSLECDLRALRLIHDNVIDTAIVFPHRLGPPYKRALRTLMHEFCNKIIQDDDAGHDSKEDAAACIQLLLVKVKQDHKIK